MYGYLRASAVSLRILPPLSAPLQVAREVRLARHFQLEFAAQGAVGQLVAQTVLRTRLGGIGKENHRSGLGSGNVIVDDVALIVEVDGLERLPLPAG